MSYQKDLDEMTTDELLEEIKRRNVSRVEGKCDYCNRSWDDTPCKFPERHRPAGVIVPPNGMRRRLPETRTSITHKFVVGSHTGYLIVGLYEDGSPGEMFIRMAKGGSTTRGLVDSIALMVSLALQHGTPLEQICDKAIGMRFEPMDHKFTSILDCVFRWMRDEFLTKESRIKNVG